MCGLKDGLAVGVVAVGVINYFLENGSGLGTDDANFLNEFGVAIRAIQADEDASQKGKENFVVGIFVAYGLVAIQIGAQSTGVGA